MAEMDLIDSSREHLSRLEPALNSIHSLGLSKELQMRNTSQIVVTYPAVQDLDHRPHMDYTKGLANRNRVLYVHIPFCSGICTYCNYARSAASSRDSRIASYLDLLEREAAIVADKMHVDRIPVDSVYIGGGTPTLLDESHLQRLLQIVQRHFSFSPEAEFTLEGSPETVSASKIRLARELGVNRISIGVESFDNRILKAIGRRHTAKGAFEAIEEIREGGIENIDIDLIRGLPGYDPSMMANDVEEIRRASVPSVTSYQYALKPQSIDYKLSVTRGSKNSFRYDEHAAILMHLVFLNGMEKAGYQHQAPIIDCFIRSKSAVYEHNLQKWRFMSDLIALGLGAYGYVNDTQFANFRNRKKYEEAIVAGKLPVEKAVKLSVNEQAHRAMVMGLKAGVPRSHFRESFGFDVLEAPFRRTLERLLHAGVLSISDEEIKLSFAGSLFADWVQMEFYSDRFKYIEERRLQVVGA